MLYTYQEKLMKILIETLAEAEVKPDQDITSTQEWAELRQVVEIYRPGYVDVEINNRRLAVIERQ